MKFHALAFAGLLMTACSHNPEKTTGEKDSSKVNPIDSLRSKIEHIVRSKNADIGVSIIDLGSGDTISIHGNKPYIMMSTVKFPQALYVLSQVDKGKLKLTDEGKFTKKELELDTYSPVRDSINKPEGYSLSIADLLRYAVGKSDNLSFDKLLQVAGGAAVLTNYIHSELGIPDMKITTGYAQLFAGHLDANQCTPNAMSTALKKFYSDKVLSDSSHAFLWKIMTETQSGPNRIKGQLPAGTVVAHKTGTYFHTEDTIRAYNDVGIIEAKRPFVIAIFVNNSFMKELGTAEAIAEIAKKAYEYFEEKK